MDLRDVVVHEGEPLFCFDLVLRILAPVDQIVYHPVIHYLQLLLDLDHMHIVLVLQFGYLSVHSYELVRVEVHFDLLFLYPV